MLPVKSSCERLSLQSQYAPDLLHRWQATQDEGTLNVNSSTMSDSMLAEELAVEVLSTLSTAYLRELMRVALPVPQLTLLECHRCSQKKQQAIKLIFFLIKALEIDPSF